MASRRTHHRRRRSRAWSLRRAGRAPDAWRRHGPRSAPATVLVERVETTRARGTFVARFEVLRFARASHRVFARCFRAHLLRSGHRDAPRRPRGVGFAAARVRAAFWPTPCGLGWAHPRHRFHSRPRGVRRGPARGSPLVSLAARSVPRTASPVTALRFSLRAALGLSLALFGVGSASRRPGGPWPSRSVAAWPNARVLAPECSSPRARLSGLRRRRFPCRCLAPFSSVLSRHDRPPVVSDASCDECISDATTGSADVEQARDR